jgi:hypothetical protein
MFINKTPDNQCPALSPHPQPTRLLSCVASETCYVCPACDRPLTPSATDPYLNAFMRNLQFHVPGLTYVISEYPSAHLWPSVVFVASVLFASDTLITRDMLLTV